MSLDKDREPGFLATGILEEVQDRALGVAETGFLLRGVLEDIQDRLLRGLEPALLGGSVLENVENRALVVRQPRLFRRGVVQDVEDGARIPLSVDRPSMDRPTLWPAPVAGVHRAHYAPSLFLSSSISFLEPRRPDRACCMSWVAEPWNTRFSTSAANCCLVF